MSHPIDNTISFRSVYEGPIVSVSDYSCRIGRGGPKDEEYSSLNQIVLMRSGAFSKHFGRRTMTADVNQAVFFSKESTYHVSHPADCGDRGTILTPSPRVLNDIVREFDPTVDDRPQWTFPFVTGPCDSGVFWRHYELVLRLEGAGSDRIDPIWPIWPIWPLWPLWIDETALQLITGVLEAAFARRGMPRKPRRDGTDADHADLTEAAKSYLASRLSERVTLDGVARAVYASPFHLARIFQRRTGMPVHRYLTRLRLRASLERLAEGAHDLTELAIELGFSSHSHFTDAFRREFGRSPSEVRRDASRRMFREMSKNLEV
jgi:AraC family transcriptional regulator